MISVSDTFFVPIEMSVELRFKTCLDWRYVLQPSIYTW